MTSTTENLNAGDAGTAAIWPLREGYVDSAGVPVYFKSVGTGEPLLLLHGGPGATHDYLVQPLLPLARCRQLIFIDQRGCGRSGAPLDDNGYALEKLVEDIEHLRSGLGLASLDVLGHSFGGVLAQAYAIAHEPRVKSLILVATGSSAAQINADLLRVKRLAAPEVLHRLEQLERQGIYGEDGAQLPEYRRLADEALRPFMYARNPPPWDTPAPAYGWAAMRALWGGTSDFEATGHLRGIDLTAPLKHLRIPTLVVYGDRDLVTDATAEETRQAIAGAEMARIEQAGHEVYVDQPAAFLRVTEAFLRRHGRP